MDKKEIIRRKYLIIILLAVILPRMLWFIVLGGSLPRPLRDQGIYLRMAGQIADGRGLSFSRDMAWIKHYTSDNDELSEAWSGDPEYMFGIVPVETPTAAIEPGYPVILGLLFMITGPVTGTVFFLNTLFAMLGALAMWRMVTENWGKTTGIIAGVIWALYPYYIYYSAYAMSETVHISLLPAVVWLTLRAMKKRNWGLGAGIAGGILFLFRSTALFLLPLQLIFVCFRKQWKSALLLLGGFILICIPWVVRNQMVMGSPLLMPTKGSLNLWMRNNPEILEIEGIELPEWVEKTITHRHLLEYPSMEQADTELERTSLLGERATSFIFANPVLFGYLSCFRFLNFISPVGSTATGFPAKIAGFIFYVPLLIMTAIEFFARRKDERIILLTSMFLLYALLHTFAHGGVRYRLPVDMVLIIGTSIYISRKLTTDLEVSDE